MTFIDRRTVMKYGAALAVASSLPAQNVRAESVVLRRSVGTMAPNDPVLESYRTAVAAMKALPSSDPRNWTKQAEIHLNHCPHGNWYFLPWHRAYLVAFERICRELCGNRDFALPYWDWTSDRQLPAVFADPLYQGQTNPLHDSTRTISNNSSLPDDMVGPDVLSTILAEPSAEVFGSSRPEGQNDLNVSWQRADGISGPLEGNPHNRIHGAVGGNMWTYMSPLDPIFWLHHCNIDRLWQEWNEAGHSNSNDPLWLTFKFSHNFVNPDRSPYSTPVFALQDIAALGYRYKLRVLRPLFLNHFLLTHHPIPRPIAYGDLKSATRNKVPTAARLNTVLSIPVALSASQVKLLGTIRPLDVSNLLSADKVPPTSARALAIISEIDPPRMGNADVRVFVNCDYLSPETPVTDPSYAGTFSFFGGEHAGHSGRKPSFRIDLTNTIIDLQRAQKAVGERLNIQLMPVAALGETEPHPVEFRPGNVQVAVL